FNTADHAIQAAIDGAGILLAHGLLAHDDLRAGRLIAPFDLTLPSRRSLYFVCPKGREKRPNVRAFREWVKQEMTCHDFGKVGAVGAVASSCQATDVGKTPVALVAKASRRRQPG
ncbi:MAG: LysR substrate-binding domain-containing protein, partial [Hyphomicrobiaceae bacterium]